MKASTSLLFVLLTTLTIAAGCNNKPKPFSVIYVLDPVSNDSLFIEWVDAGSKERKYYARRDVPNSNIVGNNVIRLAYLTNIEPDGQEAYRPSLQFDSLFIYEFTNGQRNLTYSGLNDADWTAHGSSESGYYYSIRK